MKNQGEDTFIYHITDISNLANIIKEGALLSDAEMIKRSNSHTVIGYLNIKQRRLNQILVTPGNRYVGEFVPFYFCPKSPMLFTINNGNTGKPKGCQETILHLVSRVKHGINLDKEWAISDRNAGIPYVGFYRTLDGLNKLNWDAIRAGYWADVLDEKMSEFLVADYFPWGNIIGIACFNEDIANQVRAILATSEHQPVVKAIPNWYY